MSIRTLLLSFSIALFVFSSSAVSAEQDLIAQHRIEKVSVFPLSAIIERSAQLSLPKGSGRNTFFFDGVPAGIELSSLQVEGEGRGTLLIFGAELQKRTVIEPVGAKRQELEEKIRELGYQLSEVVARQQRLESEKKLVRAVPLGGDGSEGVPPRSVAEMKKLLEFVASGVSRRDQELLALRKELFELKRREAQLKSELERLGSPEKTVSSVAVELSSPEGFQGEVTIRYETSRGSVRWTPAYRVLAALTNEKPEVTLEMYALLQQYTGEAWEDVSLEISTAEPSRGLQKPTVSPQYLDIIRPMPKRRPKFSQESAADEMAAAPLAMESAVMSERSRGGARGKGKTVFSLLQHEGSGPVEFSVPGRVTIESAGNENRIPLSENTLSGELHHIAVPSRRSEVFREIKIENTLPYPLLPGKVDIFLDEAYVGNEHQLGAGLVRPGERFQLPLGEAPYLTVSRELQRSFEEDSGIVRSFRRIEKSFAVALENLSSKPARVTVLEPAPVSRNEKIEVSLKSVSPPVVPQESEKRSDPREGILEWQVELAPKEEKKLSYQSVVEFKADLQVSGL
ncbi:mucoidy inhibitor MuiA family protein [bacterium]|nr:mucoidy inhibitor MuiA family protein [bacterium]